MPRAKMTSKGQITIPKAVRDKLGLKSGSSVCFDAYESFYLIKPLQDDPLEELEGFFNYSGKPHSIDEMNAAITDKAAEFYKESD